MRKSKLYEQLLREKDRQIELLAEQIEWLRLQLGSPGRLTPLNPTEQPEVSFTAAPYVTEAEEEVAALLEAGHITEQQIPEVLDALGFANTEIHLS